MDKVLIVLTYVYPYSNGEPFIGNERKEWERFDRVLICPLFIKPNHRIRPGFSKNDNETIYELGLEKTTFKDKISSIIGPISFSYCLSELNNLRKSKRLSLRNIKMLFEIRPSTNWKANKIEKYLIENRYIKSDDVVLVYSYWMYESALVSVGLKIRHPNWRVITRAHRYDLYETERKNRYIPYRKLILSTLDTIYSISEDGKGYLLRTNGNEYEKKIVISRLGTTKMFDDYKGDSPDVTVFVSCSNLIPVKRVGLIIEALKEYKGECKWYHLGDGEMKQKLELQAKSMPDNIQPIFMGYLPNEEIQRFYSEHYIDAFINVSESEGVPVSIMEAQSYGIPVIATDVGGTRELVHHGKNGILLSKDFTNHELLAAIEEIKKTGSSFRSNAKKTWQELSDASRNYSELFAFEIKQMKIREK